MKVKDLSYASPEHPFAKRLLIQAIEEISGRRRFLPLYRHWQTHVAPSSSRMMGDMLDLIDVRVDITGVWPPQVRPDDKLVMIANHPFGIGDGIALLSLAEQLERPYKVLINAELLKINEIRPFSLPVDFSETREALKNNIATRKAALDALRDGTTIVVFPGGGVATTAHPFRGRALELPWQPFIARLIQSAQASVLPVFIEGQNSKLFHMASHVSDTLRTSLLVSEFRRFAGSNLPVRVGEMMPFDALENPTDRPALMNELFERVMSLGLADEATLGEGPEFFQWDRRFAETVKGRLRRVRDRGRRAARRDRSPDAVDAHRKPPVAADS
ncbi:MAG: lysophospholipid acyltransferase family protein [Pseudomonadota bacterium]